MLSQKLFPATLTAYDLLKAFAVITMVIDHTGYYFFPDDLWWRAVGRLSFPVWLFLVGYARTRDLSPRLWTGAGALAALYLLAGSHVFPLNILFVILLVRLVIDQIMAAALGSRAAMAGICAALVLLILPACYVFEYGTQAVIMVMAGCMVRYGQDRRVDSESVNRFLIFAFLAYALPQFVMHGLSTTQFYVMCAALAPLFWIFSRFSGVEYPQLTARLPVALAEIIRFAGRRTLEIYVGHIILFQSIALLQGQERFGLFAFKLMPQF